MVELFKTVLVLSAFGSGIIALLLAFKPITAKRFPAKWQYYVWIVVLLCMIIPAYKFIPKKETRKIPLIPRNEIASEVIISQEFEQIPETSKVIKTPIEYKDVHITNGFKIKIDLFAYIWFCGMCIYLITIIGSYIVYIIRRYKKAVIITENSALNEVKKELRIKRNIRIRMSSDFESPMLVGVLFPVIYIPEREIPYENMRMVFLHELTHYKRKDLFIKWFSVFVNAVHWFNPLAYFLCANIGEACEVWCDMAVTKNMSDKEQKIYMKTILDLAEQEAR